MGILILRAINLIELNYESKTLITVICVVKRIQF